MGMPLLTIIKSVDESIYLYYIILLLDERPFGVEYCQMEFPLVSSNETVFNELYHETAYKKF
jgi:hypothetical protein